MRNRLILHRQILSLFINNKLGIFAVFLVGANEDEIHIGDDSEASVTAKFAFQLISQIGGVIIKEFDGLAVWQTVSRLT